LPGEKKKGKKKELRQREARLPLASNTPHAAGGGERERKKKERRIAWRRDVRPNSCSASTRKTFRQKREEREQRNRDVWGKRKEKEGIPKCSFFPCIASSRAEGKKKSGPRCPSFRYQKRGGKKKEGRKSFILLPSSAAVQ